MKKMIQINKEDLPKLYPNVVAQMRAKPGLHAYGDYQNSTVVFNQQDDYEFTSKLGRGRYSEVFKAVNLLSEQECVVKILKPVKHLKIRREVMVLETLRDSPHIV